FARGLATIERAAFFVVPPADQRFVGAPMFDPARPPVPEIGRLIVHKKVVDSAGNPALVELGNIAFQVFSSDGQAIGPAFITRSAFCPIQTPHSQDSDPAPTTTSALPVSRSGPRTTGGRTPPIPTTATPVFSPKSRASPTYPKWVDLSGATRVPPDRGRWRGPELPRSVDRDPQPSAPGP